MNTQAPHSHLRELREKAGIPVRELARSLDIHHTNIVYWEKTGRIAKVELLPPIAKLLGVTIEELLGLPKPRNSKQQGGKLGIIFDRVSQLPRRQQQKVIEMAEGFLALHEEKSGA